MLDAPGPAVEPVAQTRAVWAELGLPGLVDAHVHFLPPSIQRAVYAVFDAAGEKIGRPWPIRYRQSHAERVELLRSFGVRRFSTLPYAHRPGVATFLNDWSRTFAREVPEVIWSATLYPEPDVERYVADLVADGVEMVKVHLQVGEFDLDDPLLDPAWALLEDAGTPVMLHAGSGPVGNAFTGPASTARVLARFPRLRLVIAHMGSPECVEFLALAEQYPEVRLDTSMAFTAFFDDAGHGGYPRDLLPRLRDLQPRVLWGSDFPTLPFTYHDQLRRLVETALEAGLGEGWLRDVCWHNGAALLGAERTARP